jgi:hypothetical protein
VVRLCGVRGVLVGGGRGVSGASVGLQWVVIGASVHWGVSALTPHMGGGGGVSGALVGRHWGVIGALLGRQLGVSGA